MDFIPCSYTGQTTADERRFDGLGRYTFANGDVYVGGMQDGQFHGKGVIFFRSTTDACKDASLGDAEGTTKSASVPADQRGTSESGEDDLKNVLNPSESSISPDTNGSWRGQYRGVWIHGRHVEGQYVFQDGLVYGNEDGDSNHFSSATWTYCHSGDRRLWEEYLENVAPVLPHEALLGGAKLLHERKQAVMAAKAAGEGEVEGSGEGLPLVLPNAFVQARAAPAFASGQLSSVNDPRVTRWTAAVATEKAAKAQEAVTSSSTVSGATLAPEMVELTIALQLAVAHSTEGLRSQDSPKGGDEALKAVQPPSGGTKDTSPAKLNLSVCRVKDVEDVNRTLVQVVPAPPEHALSP